jgi:hypothetical protein
MELVVFNDRESEVIWKCQQEVKQRNKEHALHKINKKINALVELARAISQYPSIFKSSDINGNMRTAGTLVESLCNRDEIDEIMHIPTKAVLGKGYLIAKINFFTMLKDLAKPIGDLKNEEKLISQDITEIVFTLMCEDVFMGIIEDKVMDIKIRNRTAFLLANIWEYRLNHGVTEFAPILSSIWEARKKLRPVFGTMLGTSELMTLSFSIDQTWMDFLNNEELPQDAFLALEEFLFTLTYEELSELRHKMKDLGLKSVTKNELYTITGKRPRYPEFDQSDPREMYRFFRNRKQNAISRNRAGVDGPKKTIEEYIMGYILSSPKWTGSE